MPDDLTRSFNVVELAMYPKPAVGLAYDTTRGPPQGGLALFRFLPSPRTAQSTS
jgi:hypothetical protein